MRLSIGKCYPISIAEGDFVVAAAALFLVLSVEYYLLASIPRKKLMEQKWWFCYYGKKERIARDGKLETGHFWEPRLV